MKTKKLVLSKDEQKTLAYILKYMETSKKPPTLGEVLVGTGINMQELSVARSRLLAKGVVDFGFVKKYHFKPKKRYAEALKLVGKE